MGFGPQVRGNAIRREMVASAAPAAGQNPAYRPAPPLIRSGASVGLVNPTRRLLLLALIPPIAVAFLVIAYLNREPNSPGQVVEASGPMPPVSAPSLDGGRVTPDTYRGEVVVVNFWASWCAPCRKEQPGLERLWREYERGSVQFLGVNFKDDPAAARTYLEEFEVSYPSVADDGVIAHRFRVPYLPATILVDRSGQMRYRLLGAQDEAVVRGYLEELLAERV
jgi:thiol-disulfide isomerase/thioredoxin